jgi:hypothetical protein
MQCNKERRVEIMSDAVQSTASYLKSSLINIAQQMQNTFISLKGDIPITKGS